MVQYLIQWNFTNTCPLLVSKIYLDIYAMRYLRCTCFCNKIWKCWSGKYNIHHFCTWLRLFCFSIGIFSYKNKCIVHILLRRYPQIFFTSRGGIFVKLCWIQQFSISKNLLIVKTQTAFSQRNLYHLSQLKLKRTSHVCISYDSADFIVKI